MDGIIHVAQLVQTCGKIQGRKKLQKIVHILQCLGHPFRQEFGYLHFGPYSPQLRTELDQLERLELVKEKPSTTPVQGYREYTCEAEESLRQQLDELGLGGTPKWAPIADELNGLETRLLEAMSTILFLENKGFDGERLKQRFMQLKPALGKLFADAQRKIDGLRRADQ